MKTVTVYGATSYTGSTHLLPYLDTNYAGQVHLIIAGRNRSKLDALNASLSAINEKHRSVAALTLDDPEAVKALVDKSDVIINLAGEFFRTGCTMCRLCTACCAPSDLWGFPSCTPLRPAKSVALGSSFSGLALRAPTSSLREDSSALHIG